MIDFFELDKFELVVKLINIRIQANYIFQGGSK